MELTFKKFTYFYLIFIFTAALSFGQKSTVTRSPQILTLIKKDTLPVETFKDVVKITRTWDLPPILKEISGIDYLDSSHIICIQDEVGSLFIYNITTSSLEKEIPFGPPGDYEAVAVVKDVVYVACADGRLYEITNYNAARPTVKEYGTHLTVKQNIEGLSYDARNKILLVAIKGMENGNQYYKGIYSFDLLTKKMPVRPVIKIDLQDPVFVRTKSQRKMQLAIQPSEIAVHPVTGDIYITDAGHPQILIMNKSGNIKALYALNKKEFYQPEGITFSPSGECYISSEGNKQQPAKLLLVEIK